MSFKEEPQNENLSPPRVDIHVIYVKKVLTKWIFEDTHKKVM